MEFCQYKAKPPPLLFLSTKTNCQNLSDVEYLLALLQPSCFSYKHCRRIFCLNHYFELLPCTQVFKPTTVPNNETHFDWRGCFIASTIKLSSSSTFESESYWVTHVGLLFLGFWFFQLHWGILIYDVTCYFFPLSWSWGIHGERDT